VSAIVGEKVSTEPHAHGLPADGNITIWRSVDHGKSWSRSGVVNDVPGAAREGFHAIAEDAKGNLTVVWLDLRVKGTTLYSSRSSDGGRTWSKNVLVYASPSGTICNVARHPRHRRPRQTPSCGEMCLTVQRDLRDDVP
jgi:photosystem II stability/assembly factor-like uncharacterized protein